ncbi:MAG: PPC domain-containing DNA-binding protein [Nostoc sp.]|uniref:PPC domain-containing DNA-binding protein n=1 Tax=Nostoc sp. TaxID=1180 RepID=UPI002FF1D70E
MKVFAIRLKPHEDLRQSLKNFVKQENIKAGFILSAIGSLEAAKIRFANQDVSTVLTGKFEIIALNGTIATTGVHLHIAISDREGKTIGGHLDDGCIIYTTAEIVIGASEKFTFNRTFDQETGYQELEIIEQNSVVRSQNPE